MITIIERLIESMLCELRVCYLLSTEKKTRFVFTNIFVHKKASKIKSKNKIKTKYSNEVNNMWTRKRGSCECIATFAKCRTFWPPPLWKLGKGRCGSLFAYVMSRCDLDLWPLDLERSWYIKCYVIKVYTKFEQNRAILGWIINNFANFCTRYVTPWPWPLISWPGTFTALRDVCHAF